MTLMSKRRTDRKSSLPPEEQEPMTPTETAPETAPKRSKRAGAPLHVYLDPRLRAAIERLAAKHRRTLTVEVSIALEEHCAKANEWPPPDSPSP
jgi:hypothetical protein